MSEHLPAFASQPTFSNITGIKRNKTYELLAKGHIQAKKCGKSLLIDVQSGLDYIASLPDAKIGKGA